MKRRFCYIVLVLTCAFNIHAQDNINTLYFMENAPFRHTINPAFQPVSKIYIALPVIGQTSLSISNNGLSMQDIIFTNSDGQTITALHPDAEGKLWNKLPSILNIDTDINLNLVGVGRRIKDNGYLTIGVSEHMIIGVGIPKGMFSPLLGQSIESINLSALNLSTTAYAALAIGYSHRINDQWSVGGKVKGLLGMLHLSGQFENFSFTSTSDIATLEGSGKLCQAGLLDVRLLLPSENEENNEEMMDEEIITENLNMNTILSYIKPQGFGGAIDLGFTYKPVQNLQIAVSATDIGLIYWKGGSIGSIQIDTTFTGVGEFEYADYVENGKFQTEKFKSDITTNLEKYATALHINNIQDQAFKQMLTANLNIGIDANFWKNRIGVGLYSHTRFFNMLENLLVTEEITFGAAFRPANWFNMAISYSFINSNWSNAGFALSLAPYDGIMITVAADYIPLSYANYSTENNRIIPIPYKTGNVNISFGTAIVIGTNHKKKTKNPTQI